MESLYVNIPVAAALIAMTVKFLDFWAKERAEDRKLWENHLSSTVKVLVELKDEVKELRSAVAWGLRSK